MKYVSGFEFIFLWLEIESTTLFFSITIRRGHLHDPFAYCTLVYWSNISIPFSLSIVDFLKAKSSELFKQSACIKYNAGFLSTFLKSHDFQTAIHMVIFNGIFMQYDYLRHNGSTFSAAIFAGISSFPIIFIEIVET